MYDKEKDWDTVRIKIAELKDFPNNPRTLSKVEYEKLVKSIKQDGYHDRIKVNQDNMMVGGHQRKKALLAAGYMPHDTIEVLKPKRDLTEHEFRRINIRSNLHNGEFDFDTLANAFEMEELVEAGFDLKWFPDVCPPEVEKQAEPKPQVFKEYCPTCGHEMKDPQ